MYELVGKVSSLRVRASARQKLQHGQVWDAPKTGNMDCGMKRDSNLKRKVIFVFSMYELIKHRLLSKNENPTPSVSAKARWPFCDFRLLYCKLQGSDGYKKGVKMSAMTHT